MAEVTQAYSVGEPLGPLGQLTRGSDPVAQASLIPGGSGQLLIRRDHNGDEQFQLFRYDRRTDIEERLTDGKSRHGSYSMNRVGGLAFSSNQRDPSDMDVYVASVRGAFKQRRIVERGGQWSAGAWSPAGDQLLVRNYRSADSSSVYLAAADTGELSPLSIGRGEAIMRDARFAGARDKAFMVTDGGGDIAELFEVELSSGTARSLTSDIPWDVELVAVSNDRSRLAFVTNEDGYSALYFFDETNGERKSSVGIPRGVISTLQFVGSTGAVAFSVSTAKESADAYVYSPDTEVLVRWTASESEVLERKPFVDPERIRYESFDGLSVPAYVYRPPGDGPFPVLLWIHGGPEEQHRPTFDPLLQFFVVERGIAVVAPNIRGSVGYGRRYLGLDDGIRRADAIKDVGALLDWIVNQPELDAGRVGIYGASYGGFVVLASLIEFGDRLRAGCDLVGISHFTRFLENTSEYRKDLRRAEYGDERDEEVRAVLEQLSPLTNADKIQVPLLVGHGANDPRVPVGEAEQIVSAVRAQGVEVWYMLARDEGHGFRKRRSRDLFYSVMAAFFDAHLVNEAPAPDPLGEPGAQAP